MGVEGLPPDGGKRRAGAERRWKRWLCVIAVFFFVMGPAVGEQGEAQPLPEVVHEYFFVVEGEPATVRILQGVRLHNAGSSPAEDVRISLPEGARILEPPQGWGSVRPEQGGLVDSQPLEPGETREYRVIYEMTMGSRPLALRRPLFYPVGEMMFWVQADAFTLTGLQLLPLGEEVLGGERFTAFGMRRVGPHEAWQVVLRRQDATGAGAMLPDLSRRRHGDPLRVWGELMERYGWAIALLLAAWGVLALARRVREAGREVNGRARPEAALEDEIVKLDVAFRAGELDEDVYRSRRRELLEKILQLDAAGAQLPAATGKAASTPE